MIIMIIIIGTESEKLINKATNIYIFLQFGELTHMKSHAYFFFFLQEHIHTQTRGAFHLTWHSSQ